MIQDLQVGADGVVSLRAVLTTPACPLKAKIEADIRQAVLSVPGVKKVDIRMDAKTRSMHEMKNAIAGVSHIIAV